MMRRTEKVLYAEAGVFEIKRFKNVLEFLYKLMISKASPGNKWQQVGASQQLISHDNPRKVDQRQAIE